MINLCIIGMNVIFILFSYLIDIYKWAIFIASCMTVQNTIAEKLILQKRHYYLKVALICIESTLILGNLIFMVLCSIKINDGKDKASFY